MLSALEQQLLQTLAYSDFFSYPLSSKELELRLIKVRDLKLDSLKLRQALSSLIKKKLIKEFQGYYFFKDKRIIKQRQLREKIFLKKQTELQMITDLIIKIPWIKAIGVTGSLSMKNSSENDDVDFIIICQNHRLWLSRFVLIIWLLSKKEKDLPWKTSNLKWCFNLWLSEENLSIPFVKRNLYTAYETCQILWLADDGKIVKRFLTNNKWVKKYLFNYWNDLKVKSKNLNQIKSGQQKFIFLFNLIDYWLYFLQKFYLIFKVGLKNGSMGQGFAFLHKQSLAKDLERHLADMKNSFIL